MILAQYREAKAKYPGVVLLFKTGNYFELLDGDADIAGRVLSLTVVHRDGHRITGFPRSVLEYNLGALLRAGHRVAICEQVEKAANVEKVITQGEHDGK